MGVILLSIGLHLWGRGIADNYPPGILVGAILIALGLRAMKGDA